MALTHARLRRVYEPDHTDELTDVSDWLISRLAARSRDVDQSE